MVNLDETFKQLLGMPTAKDPTMLMDVGANSDCRPEMLTQFAVMGSCYMNKIMGMNLKIRAYQEKNGLLPKPFKMKTDEEVIRLYKEIFGEEDFKDGKANN